MQQAPVYQRKVWRPWLWPLKLMAPFTEPVPPGLWLTNVLYQRVLGVNNEIPWMVHFTSRVIGKITIGENVWSSFALSGSCYIQGGNGIEIGDDTIFAPGVKMISANHNSEQLDEWEHSPPIIIGKRCWIGVNAVLLPGSGLGENTIVGAGAVVTKRFPAGSKIGGIPAQLIS